MRATLTTVTASLLVAAASARSDCSLGTLCLTAFRWCDYTPCQYPDWAYPYKSDMNGQPGYALIAADADYVVTWAHAVPAFPVEFTWSFPPSTDIAEAHEQPNIEWSKNITNANRFTFNPGKILDDFPPSLARNLSALELRAVVNGLLNVITIRQRGVIDGAMGLEDAVSSSNQFAVASGDVTTFIDTYGEIARRREKERWPLPIGLSVGLVVPILMGIVAFATWKYAMRVAEKRFNGTGASKVVTDA